MPRTPISWRWIARRRISEKEWRRVWYGSVKERRENLLCFVEKPHHRNPSLLSRIFGLGGFHRLYVKKWMTGLLYLMTFGLFFLGTAYDLHQLIVERFKDTDGFPLYSDGSMRQNYRRRRPKGRTPVGIKIVVPLALPIFLPRCRWRKRKQKQSRNSSKRIFRRAQMRSTIRCRRFPCMPDMNRSGA